ncbi:MAG: hypothetical protein WCJ49_03995 [Deltaproteobacteria bacterium]
MKIAGYSIGGIDRASSRLRSFYLFSFANEYDLNVSRPSQYRDALGCDVVHIQKIMTYQLILWVVVYRIFGIRVVFDIDDQPTGYKSFLGYLVVLFLSSVITVDSDARKSYWKKYLFFKKIEVINDIADSNDINLKIKERGNSIDASSFFWIGYASNLESLDGFIEFIKKTAKYKLIVSVEKEAIASLKSRYPFITFIPWFDDVAFDDCIDAKFMVLNHNFDQDSLLKSENKMVLAILAGFVPIVSRTPSYEKLAKLLDAEFLLFDNIEDITRIVANLAETDFHTFFEKAFDFIKKNYSRNAVLSDFNMKVLCR